MNSIAGSPPALRAEALHEVMLAAHAEGDGTRLSALYREAADRAEAQGDIERACFFLTHAFVFALEAGLADADALEARLRAQGRA